MPAPQPHQNNSTFSPGPSLHDVFFSARQHYGELNAEDLSVPATPKGYKITESIYVSHWIPSHNPDFLKAFGIKSILCLDGKLKPDWAPALGVERIATLDIPDGPGFTAQHLSQAVRALDSLVANHAPVLVCCHAGQSRSPAVVIGYIAIKTHLSLRDSYALVRRERAAERQIKIWPSMDKALKTLVAG